MITDMVSVSFPLDNHEGREMAFQNCCFFMIPAFVFCLPSKFMCASIMLIVINNISKGPGNQKKNPKACTQNKTLLV